MKGKALASLQPRTTQIFPAEVIAVLACLHEHNELLSNRDVVFFIDNESGCSSLIRGSTSAEDVAHFVHLVHFTLLKAGARGWFEWVDTHSNPADGLGRDGLLDSWTLGQGWSLAEAREYELEDSSFFLPEG